MTISLVSGGVPCQSTCSPWATIGDLCPPCDSGDYDEQTMAGHLQVASDILFHLSGRQFAGSCQDVCRPCARSLVMDHGRPFHGGFGGGAGYYPGPWLSGNYSQWGFCSCNQTERSGCSSVPEITLGVYPLTGIVEVKIDGAVVDPTTYRIDDNRWLVRTVDPVTKQPLGWPCFPAGTLVLTDTGLKPIESIRPGERVLTHRNRWKVVTRSGQTGMSPLVKIAGRGGTVQCTPDHQFLAAEVFDAHPKSERGGYARKLGSPDWVNASQLIGQAWATPRAVESLPVPIPAGWEDNDQLWWIVGRWVADGTLQKRRGYSVYLEVGRHKAEDVAGHIGQNWYRYEKRTAVRFRLANKPLHEFLSEHFGRLSAGKYLPAWLLGAPERIRRTFLEGYLSGDGWTRPVRGHTEWSARTVSRRLALGLRLLAASLGYAPMSYDRAQTTTEIEGRAVTGQHTYRVDWNDVPPGGVKSQAWADDEHLWGRVRSVVLNDLVVPVYDIEVEDDHSFIADGFVVHNCCQNMQLDSDQPDTFEVTFVYGTPAPPGGVRACAELACQLALACDPSKVGSCSLPQRVTQVTRQGMTAIVLDPFAFLDKGLTGIYAVDLWLASINPSGLRRRSVVSSPDIGKRVRRAGY